MQVPSSTVALGLKLMATASVHPGSECGCVRQIDKTDPRVSGL